MTAQSLNTPAKVRAWAERMRSERLNETGRALIDFAEELLLRAIARRGVSRAEALEAVAPHIDKAVRAALQADRGEVDRTMVELRRQLAAREAMGSQFDGIH